MMKTKILDKFGLPEIFHDNVSVIVGFEKPVSIFEMVGMHIFEGLTSN